jgi:hypothetical protein
MLSLRGRAAAGLTIFALGFGVAACGDRENTTKGNQGDTPGGPTTQRQPETSSVGNEPVAPTTSSSSSDSSGSGGSAYP